MDRSDEQVAKLLEDSLRRKPLLAVIGRASNQSLEGLLVQDPAVDRSFVELTEGEQRGERNPPIARREGAVLEQGEDERCRLFGERRIGILAENRGLRPLGGIEQTELRADLSRPSVSSAEFRGDGAMQFDQILRRQVADLSP